jgi:hypothetical protein
MATVPDAETKCSIAANITADELTRCAATATTEPATSISPHSATYAEWTKPRRSRFGPLFQVWHEWSSHPIVSQQAVRSWSRRPVTTSRAAELHLRQDQPRDYWRSSTGSRHCIGYVPCKLTSCNSFIWFRSIAFLYIIIICSKVSSAHNNHEADRAC